MIVVDLLQGSDDWKRWRSDGITASALPTICGYNPHKTPYQLFAEMLGWLPVPDLGGNPNVRRGKRREEKVRQRVEEKLGCVLTPLCAEWEQNRVFKASLDGATPNGNKPVELKNPSSVVFEEVKANGWNSIHVKHYAVQVQAQMLVTGAPEGLLVFSDDDEDLAFRLPRRQQFIDKMVQRGLHFLRCLQAGTGIEPDPQRDVFIAHRSDSRLIWEAAEKKVEAIDQRLETISEEQSELKEARAEIANELAATLGEFSVGESHLLRLACYESTGTIDYKKLWEAALKAHPDILKDYNPEDYRRAGTNQKRLTSRA